jgi:Na+-driven multidrug efflux pump
MKMDLGITGTGIAGVITNFTCLVFNLIYSSILKDIRSAIFFPDHRTFEGIRDYLVLGIPSTFMLCLDCWAGNLVVFFAGYISKSCLAA